jgi:hypothetical protein
MKTALILGAAAVGAFILIGMVTQPAPRKLTTLDNTAALAGGGLVAAGSALWDRFFGDSGGSSSSGATTHTPIDPGETVYV